MIPLQKKGLGYKVSHYFPRCVIGLKVALILFFEVEKNQADKVKLRNPPGTVIWCNRKSPHPFRGCKVELVDYIFFFHAVFPFPFLCKRESNC